MTLAATKHVDPFFVNRGVRGVLQAPQAGQPLHRTFDVIHSEYPAASATSLFGRVLAQPGNRRRILETAVQGSPPVLAE